MTEQEWLECTDPDDMLEFLRGKASERKLRLFAVACCRLVWHLLTDERSRRVVEIAEECVERKIGSSACFRAAQDAKGAAAELKRHDTAFTKAQAMAAAAAAIVGSGLLEGSGGVWGLATGAELVAEHTASATAIASKHVSPSIGAAGRPTAKREREAQCRLVHNIFGNPYHPVTIDPSWLAWNDSTVVKLAQPIYEDRAFDRLPILADALEESGCANSDILNHCRSEGPHVRGCWALDLLLGKE